MNRAGRFGRDMAGNSAGERELFEQPFHPFFVWRDARINVAVRALQISVRHQPRPAVPWPGDVDDFQVLLLDDAVQVDVDEVQARRRSPVSQQARLDMLQRERLFKQRIVVEVNLSHGQVVRRAPPGVHLAQKIAAQEFCFCLCFHTGGLISILRELGFFHGVFLKIGTPPICVSARTRQTDLAIINSSSVRMTRTMTRLASAEMTSECDALRDWFSSKPRKPSPSQMRARTGAAFSPMPPAKTSVSSPPRTAAYAPIHFLPRSEQHTSELPAHCFLSFL